MPLREPARGQFPEQAERILSRSEIKMGEGKKIFRTNLPTSTAEESMGVGQRDEDSEVGLQSVLLPSGGARQLFKDMATQQEIDTFFRSAEAKVGEKMLYSLYVW